MRFQREKRYYCYLLVRCASDTFTWRTCMGVSTEPLRRQKQRNRRYNGRTVWRLDMIIGGFMTKRQAVAFDWQWKHKPCDGLLQTRRSKVIRKLHDVLGRALELKAQPQWSRLSFCEIEAPHHPMR